MWFPNEIIAQIKDYMLDYKKTFDKKILPFIYLQKPSYLINTRPMFLATDCGPSRYLYELSYDIPRYNINEERLNKLGFTNYGPKSFNKSEKIYTYLKTDRDWLVEKEEMESIAAGFV